MVQKRNHFLPYSLPLIGKEEIQEVTETLESGWLSKGPKVQQFEKEFAAFVGAKHAVAVNSCTAALFLALKAKGIGRGRGHYLSAYVQLDCQYDYSYGSDACVCGY